MDLVALVWVVKLSLFLLGVIGVTVEIACAAMLWFEFWVWLVCVLLFSGRFGGLWWIWLC